jgi:large subunit ribosomal protein L9
MKVILLEDVYKQGVAGELVEVAPGFARNFLIPRKLAVKATPGALRQFQNLSKQADIRRAERQHQYNKIAEQIAALTLTFPVKAGETGKLYGSITPTDVAESLQKSLGIEIDRRRIGDRPLRELGVFTVPVRLDAGIVSHVKVIIHREGETPAAAEAEALTRAAAEEMAEIEVAQEVQPESSSETEIGAVDGSPS